MCAACHLPGGVAQLNLSSYQRWLDKRVDIYERVITQRRMPPAGTDLAENDRTKLKTWMDDPDR